MSTNTHSRMTWPHHINHLSLTQTLTLILTQKQLWFLKFRRPLTLINKFRRVFRYLKINHLLKHGLIIISEWLFLMSIGKILPLMIISKIMYWNIHSPKFKIGWLLPNYSIIYQKNLRTRYHFNLPYLRFHQLLQWVRNSST
jgi:hypothetical protein